MRPGGGQAQDGPGQRPAAGRSPSAGLRRRRPGRRPGVQPGRRRSRHCPRRGPLRRRAGFQVRSCTSRHSQSGRGTVQALRIGLTRGRGTAECANPPALRRELRVPRTDDRNPPVPPPAPPPPSSCSTSAGAAVDARAPREAVRRRGGGLRDRPRDRRRRVLLDARAVGIGQDDDAAHDRRLRDADRGAHPAARQGRDRRPALRSRREHRLPGLRALPAHDGRARTWPTA